MFFSRRRLLNLLFKILVESLNRGIFIREEGRGDLNFTLMENHDWYLPWLPLIIMMIFLPSGKCKWEYGACVTRLYPSIPRKEVLILKWIYILNSGSMGGKKNEISAFSFLIWTQSQQIKWAVRMGMGRHWNFEMSTIGFHCNNYEKISHTKRSERNYPSKLQSYSPSSRKRFQRNVWLDFRGITWFARPIWK